jgi:aquaporin Z
MADPSLTATLVAEFVGTFLLIFTVGCNVLSANAVWAGVSIASVLMVSIYALGGISGANFNPAVTLSLALATTMGKEEIKMDWGKAASYMGVQVLAGVLAAFSYGALFMDSFNLGPAKGFSYIEAGLCEMLYTFMLCFVVLNVATAKNLSGNQYYGLAIGFVIVAGAYGAGAVSGGCFNPAVAIGIDLASFMKGFGACLVYVPCELVGAALAAALFRVVRPGDFGAETTGAEIYVSEFLGTFVLVLTVGLNVLGKSPAGAYSIAASLMCMIYALGDVSGAHFNPAVTLAILASNTCPDLTPAKAGAYMAVQICGGVVAAFTYSLIRKGDSFGLGPSGKISWAQVGVAEVVFTFVLCYVVLCVAVAKKTNAPTMFGLLIGACVTVGGNAIGAISGGSLNPAVSFGIGASHSVSNLLNALIYTLFEFVGAAMAAGVFMVTHAVEYEDAKKPLAATA